MDTQTLCTCTHQKGDHDTLGMFGAVMYVDCDLCGCVEFETTS